MKVYFACWFRLDGGDRYVIWFTVEDATTDQDGVFVDAIGRVPVFRTLPALLHYADNQGLEIQAETPILHDLDAVSAWLRQRTRDVRQIHTRGALLAAWNLFSDLSRSVDGDFAPLRTERELTLPIWSELFWGERTHWRTDELAILRRVLREGLTLFRRTLYLSAEARN